MNILSNVKYSVTIHYRGLTIDETKQMLGRDILSLTQSNPSMFVDQTKDSEFGNVYKVSHADGFRYKTISVRPVR